MNFSFSTFKRKWWSGGVLRDEVRQEGKSLIIEAEWLELYLWDSGKIVLQESDFKMMILKSGILGGGHCHSLR